MSEPRIILKVLDSVVENNRMILSGEITIEELAKQRGMSVQQLKEQIGLFDIVLQEKDEKQKRSS